MGSGGSRVTIGFKSPVGAKVDAVREATFSLHLVLIYDDSIDVLLEL